MYATVWYKLKFGQKTEKRKQEINIIESVAMKRPWSCIVLLSLYCFVIEKPQKKLTLYILEENENNEQHLNLNLKIIRLIL